MNHGANSPQTRLICHSRYLPPNRVHKQIISFSPPCNNLLPPPARLAQPDLYAKRVMSSLKQIEAKYDGMSQEDRADFDTRMKGLMDCPACAQNYIITLGPPVSQHQMKSGIGSLKNVSFSLLEKRVYLANESGQRRELVHFVAPKHDEDEATFFFPRLDESGKPLLTTGNKSLIFIFEAKNLRTGWALDSIPERYEFDVSKLVLNGKVEF